MKNNTLKQTTLKLIERGVGANCLSDAYDLGVKDALTKCLSFFTKDDLVNNFHNDKYFEIYEKIKALKEKEDET